MGGLFGGGAEPVTPVQTPVAQANTDMNKGKTDLEKLQQKKELQRSYNKGLGPQLGQLNGISGDTSLASGSLLGLS